MERISTSTTEFENKTGYLAQEIDLNIDTDKFTKDKDKIIWKKTKSMEKAITDEDFTSGFTTNDINSEQYMSYTIGKYYADRVVNSKNSDPTFQETKVAELKDNTLFTNIAEYDCETFAKSGDTDRNQSSKNQCNKKRIDNYFFFCYNTNEYFKYSLLHV